MAFLYPVFIIALARPKVRFPPNDSVVVGVGTHESRGYQHDEDDRLTIPR
jgi:hypothetical protein